MPVRLLKKFVWRWRAQEQVLEDLQARTQQQHRRVQSLQFLGVFGSYGSSTAAFGSDLDLTLFDAWASGGQIERLQQGPLAELLLSCDDLVLTPAELDQRLNDGSRMAMELKHDLRWML